MFTAYLIGSPEMPFLAPLDDAQQDLVGSLHGVHRSFEIRQCPLFERFHKLRNVAIDAIGWQAGSTTSARIQFLSIDANEFNTIL